MSGLCGRYREAFIELCDVAFPEKLVGGSQAANAVQAQFLWQTPLPGTKAAFSSSTGLWGVGRDHLDSQLRQCPAHLGRSAAIDRLTRFRGMEEMAGPIAVERTESAFALDHFAQ